MIFRSLDEPDSLVLPDDLLWIDEHEWSPVVSTVSYLITGALLVQSATRSAGRPITLVAPQDMAWVPRSIVNTLQDWAAIPLTPTGGHFQLELNDDRSFNVAFRHDLGALEAQPVAGFPARSDHDFFRITLRLMEL